MKRKAPKGRNPVAYALALRGKGQVMKDRRAPRGPNRSAKRDVEQALSDEALDSRGYPKPDEEEDGLIVEHVFDDEWWEADSY